MTELEIKLRLYESIAASAKHFVLMDCRGNESNLLQDIPIEVERAYAKLFKK